MTTNFVFSHFVRVRTLDERKERLGAGKANYSWDLRKKLLNTLFQNGRHFSILLCIRKLALVSLFKGK